MVKIHIIGAPGSGKTTLAQDISSQLHIPHYDLDKVDWELENAVAIAAKPEWITEGIYLIWTEPMLYHADYIVVLYVSWPIAAWRMIRRHLLNSLRGINPYPGINGLKALFKLVKDTRRYILNLDSTPISSVEALYVYLEIHREIAAPPTKDFLQAYSETYQGFVEPPSEEFVLKYLERYKEKTILVKHVADREHLLELLTKR